MMVKKNKLKKLCKTAAIGGVLITGLHTIAYAVITDYVIKVNDQIYSYNQSQLEDSFLDYKSGNSSKLYEDFHEKLAKASSFHAFKDDKKGFIPYENIETEFLEAKNDKKAFDINKFIEADKCKSIEIKSVKTVGVDEKGSVLIKDNDDKTKETDDSEKSSSSSSGRSSRGGSSSKRNKEEIKKVVPDVQPVPEVKKEEKNKEADKKVPPMPKQFEDSISEDSKRVVKEAVKPEAISTKTKGNVSIKSETTQTAQRGYSAQKQITTILVEGEATTDGTIEILGHKIEIKKGDNYYRVVSKIEKEFKDDKKWEVKYRYGQWGTMGNITFHGREFAEHVNIGVQKSGENGLTYKIKNEAFGELALAEREEVCTATVLNDSTADETLKVKVYADVIKKTFATVKVEIKKGETKEKIAEKIANKLKEDKEITQYFKVENKGSQVIVTQKLAHAINLSITMV